MEPNGLYFAQITDIHVGNNNLNGEAARRHLRLALAEIAGLTPTPRCILATADLVCSGRRAELDEYLGLVADAKLPIHPLPSNHDLWGEPDDAAWIELCGPLRRTVDLDELRLVLFQDIRRKPGGGWHAHLLHEDMEWLAAQLAGRSPGRSLLACHAPILAEAGDFHDVWQQSNASELLALARTHGSLGLITGHWHRVGEWTTAGIRIINVGALAGWQWTGIPPYYSFPVRAGYALYHHCAGSLRWFWRELCSQECRPAAQVNLVNIGPVHTGGPRPQVRPVEVFTRVLLRAQSCVPGRSVDGVEWSLCRGQWQMLRATFNGLWQDWEGELDPRAFRAGDQVLVVRLLAGGKPVAYDAVPVCLAEAQSPPLAPAQPRRETVFELFYLPE